MRDSLHIALLGSVHIAGKKSKGKIKPKAKRNSNHLIRTSIVQRTNVVICSSSMSKFSDYDGVVQL